MTDALPDSMGHKVGPFPMGAWLAIAGVGLGVAFVIRRQSATATPVATVQGSDLTPLDNTVATAGNLGAGVDSNPSAGISLGGGAPVIATNEDWAVAAQRSIFAKGYDPTTVNTAIRKYLNGDSLTTQENAIIGLSLIAVGPPPVSPPPPVSGVAPGQAPVPQLPVAPQPGPARPALPTPHPVAPHTVAPKPAPAPAAYVYVRPGDSLSKIAARNHTTWQHLQQLNPSIRNPNLIFPGQRIRIR